MARRARYSFLLPDQQTRVGYSLKLRGDVYRVQFPHPTEAGKYVELSTGCYSEADAHTAAAKVVLKVYAPILPPDAKRATWADVLEALPTAADLRERTLDTYWSAVRVFRGYVPSSNGPADVTTLVAKRFRHEYGRGGYKRSRKPNARSYRRSPKTVENAVRRLSGLWNHLRQLEYVVDNPWETVPRPTVPRKPVTVPSEETVTLFFRWLTGRYPAWELPALFVQVKALAGCRTMDLCQVRSSQIDARANTLTIAPDQDKTHRLRVVPLPRDVVLKLDRIKGPAYLWESYAADARRHRPGTRNRDDFSPRTLYWCVNNLFREFSAAHPSRKLTPHDLRRRAITLTTLATQSVDQTAQAIGIDPTTARRYYLDAKQAFDGTELLKRMADVLRPK